MEPRRGARSAEKPARTASKPTTTFNAQAFLDSDGISRQIVEYKRGEAIFTQGDPCDHVLYIQAGGVKLSVLSKTGREAVVAMLGPGDFFGEVALLETERRTATVRATTPMDVIVMFGRDFKQMEREMPKVADRVRSAIRARLASD